jgi:hypothetical protein
MCGVSIFLVSTRAFAVNTQQSIAESCAGTPVPVNPPTQPKPTPTKAPQPQPTPTPTTVPILPTPTPILPLPSPTIIPTTTVIPTATVVLIPTAPVIIATPTILTSPIDTILPITSTLSTTLLQPVLFSVCTPTPVPTTPAGSGGVVPPQPTTANGQTETPTPPTNPGTTPTATNHQSKKSAATPAVATPQPNTGTTTPSTASSNTAVSAPQQSSSSPFLLWIILVVGAVVLLLGGGGVYWLLKRKPQPPARVRSMPLSVPQTPPIPWSQQKTLEPAAFHSTNELTIASPVLSNGGVASATLIPPPLDKNVVLPPPPTHVLPAAQAQNPFAAVQVQPPLSPSSSENFSYKPAELQPLSVSLSQTFSMTGNQNYGQQTQNDRALRRHSSMDGLDLASLFDQPQQTVEVPQEEAALSTDHPRAVTEMTTLPPLVPDQTASQGTHSQVELPSIHDDPLLETILKQAQFGIYAPAARNPELQTS